MHILAISADFPIRVLAVIGAAALGGLLLAGGIQIISALIFQQKIPHWPLWIVRVLGAIACAWVTALILFNVGGGGQGLLPGDGPGEGTGLTASSKDDSTAPKTTDPGQASKPDLGQIAQSRKLEIEILGDAHLKRRLKTESPDPEKRYRIAGQKELLTQDQVRKLILARRGQEPPLELLVLVLAKDSPDRRGPFVASLERWAADLEENGKPWLLVSITTTSDFDLLD